MHQSLGRFAEIGSPYMNRADIQNAAFIVFVIAAWAVALHDITLVFLPRRASAHPPTAAIATVEIRIAQEFHR